MNRAATRTVALALVVLGMGALVSQVRAYPQPSTSNRYWQFDFTHEMPRPVAVPKVSGGVEWYWAMPYKVVNRTKAERLFVPEIVIATDQGDILNVPRNVPLAVYEAYKQKIGNPLLENPNEVTGRMLQGEDQAKESIMIWKALDHDIDEMSIFIAGLSGEATQIKEPQSDKEITLRKTLMLTYKLPGTGGAVTDNVLKLTSTQWVMR